MKVNAISMQRLMLPAFAVVMLSFCTQGQGQPDYSKVEIKTTKLANNFYTLEGTGGTIGVLAGPDGIFMVDDEFAPLSPKIVAAIKTDFGPADPIPREYARASGPHGRQRKLRQNGRSHLLARTMRDRLMHPNPAANGAPGTPAPAAALPIVTYEGRVRFHMDGEDVELVPIPRAHTDGDTMVYFPSSDVIMSGDFYRSIQYPNIDRANGGSLNGMLDGLGVLIGMAGPNTKIVPGHGPVVSRAEVMAQRDMILAVRDRVAQLVAQGKTQEEVLAAHPTADFDARVPNSKETTDRFVTQLYAELKPAR